MVLATTEFGNDHCVISKCVLANIDFQQRHGKFRRHPQEVLPSNPFTGVLDRRASHVKVKVLDFNPTPVTQDRNNSKVRHLEIPIATYELRTRKGHQV